jgi:hypothetical protein
MARFNKAKIISDLEERAESIRIKFNFDRNNGHAQLKDGDKLRAIAYGEWRKTIDLANEICEGRIGV